MRIQIYLGLNLIEFSPDKQRAFLLDVEISSTVRDVYSKLGIPFDEDVLITVNEKLTSLSTVLHEGDKIKLYPLLSGG